jgi:hypothetical protein
MKKNFLNGIVLSSALTLLLANTAAAGDLSGARFVVSNLFMGNATKGVEVDVTQFGLVNNLFATVGDGVELPSFITLYDIDISGSSVDFNWVESTFSKKVEGSMPDDKHDRNYFMFDLPEGKEIASIEFDAERSSLHEGSALPTAKLISSNKFMTEFAAGVIRKSGFKPSFKITFK